MMQISFHVYCVHSMCMMFMNPNMAVFQELWNIILLAFNLKYKRHTQGQINRWKIQMIYISFSRYGSTEAFLADIKWILHNCIIFNSTASKLTSVAKTLVKVITTYLIYTKHIFY